MKRTTRCSIAMIAALLVVGACLTLQGRVETPPPASGGIGSIRLLYSNEYSLQLLWRSLPGMRCELYLSERDNIVTVEDCRSRGTLIEAAYGLDSYTVVGLTADTTYRFNVVAVHPDGSTYVYNMQSATTKSLPGSSQVRDLGFHAPNPVWTGGDDGLDFYCADNIVPTFFGIGVDHHGVASEWDFVRGKYAQGGSDMTKVDGPIVTLLPRFLDTLEDGEHVLALSFADIQGRAAFVVDRVGIWRPNPDTGAAESCGQATLPCPFC